MKTTQNKKTVGKTTELGMKGARDILTLVNAHICNINKKNRYSLELYTEEQIMNYVTKNEHLQALAVQLGQVHNVLIDTALDNWHKSLEKKTTKKATKKKKGAAKKAASKTTKKGGTK